MDKYTKRLFLMCLGIGLGICLVMLTGCHMVSGLGQDLKNFSQQYTETEK
jgi:predicted small secreted protein